MVVPTRPSNPRIVYPDGHTVPIRQMWFGETIDGTHVWVSEDPVWVPWVPGVRTDYDHSSSGQSHYVLVGFDYGEL